MDIAVTYGAFMKYGVPWGDVWKQTSDNPLTFQWQLVHTKWSVIPHITSPYKPYSRAHLGQFKLKNTSSWAVIDIYTPSIQLQLPDRQHCPQSNSGCYQIFWDYQTWWHWSDRHHGVPELDGIFQWQLQKWGVLGETSPFLATVAPCQWRWTTPAACCLDRTEKIWCQMLCLDFHWNQLDMRPL